MPITQDLSLQAQKAAFMLQQLQAFIQNAVKLKAIDAKQATAFTTQISETLKTMKGENDLEKTLRKLISEINGPMEEAKVPLFPLYPEDGPVSQAKSHIIAFEIFLNQKLSLGEVALEKEKSLFNQALFLWKDIQTRRSVNETMQELNRLIVEFNRECAGKEAYPLPPLDAYV